jgi:hypothetical protein
MKSKEQIAAAIRAKPAAMREAVAGRNGHLLVALDAARWDEEGQLADRQIGDELLNAALLLIPESLYARYMRNEFVNPEDVKLHYTIKAATDQALEEDRQREAAKREGRKWPRPTEADLAPARAAAARRGGV